MFSNLSLRTKLYLQFGIVLLPVLLVLGYLLHDNHTRFTAVTEKFGRYNDAVDAERQYKHFIDAVTDAVDSGKLGLSGLIALKKAHDLLASSGAQTTDAKTLLNKLNSMHQSLSGNVSLENLGKHRETIQQAKIQVTKTVEEFDTGIASDIGRDLERAKQGIIFSRVLTVLIAFIAFFLARGLIKSILLPLQCAITIADRISKGNLNNPPAPENKTEIGELLSALNGMNARLRELIGEIMGTSQQIGGASENIQENNAILIERAREAAYTLEETSASLDILTGTVGQTADRTQSAQMLAREAVSQAEGSSKVVRDMVTTMEDIQSSSHRIVDIIAVIDSIAFQTNILALNAAIEAARAGVQGAGFAVVASEVRSLAQRSATAAKDIKSLIGSSVEKIGVGTHLADNAGKAMDSTVTSIHQVSELLGEIAAASTEQREGISQINQAMQSLDQATQRSGNVVDRAAGIAEMLSNHAQNLNKLFSQFDLGHRPQPARMPTATSKRLARSAKSPEQ